MSSQPGRGGWITVIRLLPRDLSSHAVGRLASVRLPRPLRAPAWRTFAAAVGADLSEVRDPLDGFESLQQFFTRALRDGARPIDPAADAFVAPCDGAWGESGRVASGRLVQVKGRSYALADLLDDAALAERFEGGAFATFYLAPRDYHRFHTPCALRIRRAVHVPGGLWPVNRIGLEGVPDLFARNERICAHATIDRDADDGDPAAPAADAPPDLVMVAVGATLVGRIRLAFDDLTTHRRGAVRTAREYAGGVPFARGAEWGRFEFGSTLVVVAAPGAVALPSQPPGTPLRLGEAIGRLGAGAG